MRPAVGVIAIVLAALPGSAAAQAQIYESKEKSGVPVFSDTPSPGSKEVTLPPPNISDAPMPSVDAQMPAPSGAYSQLSIVSPGAEGTVHSNTGAFTINVSVNPELNSDRGDRFLVRLDGNTLPRRYATPTIDVTTDDLGTVGLADNIEHRLEVSIVDSGGTVLIAATPVNFYLRRAIVYDRGIEKRVIQHHKAR